MIKIDMTDKAKSEFKGNILGKLKALKKNSKLKSFPAARGRKEPCTAFLYAINVIQSIYLL